MIDRLKKGLHLSRTARAVAIWLGDVSFSLLIATFFLILTL